VGDDGPSKVIGVSVPESLLDGLTALAKKEGWSLSKAVTEAIRGLLKRTKRA
jgi:metal-responsive CopG/Arc/MetJ family transcriptional regulator